MAYGSELFLGVQNFKEFPAVLHPVGLECVLNTIYDLMNIEPDEKYNELNARLEQAHKEALIEMGFEILNGVEKGHLKRYTFIQTPVGVRVMVPWGLEVQYDPHEMGDTEDTAVLGVSLISRYFPAFLDWRLEHGGSGDNIALTPETLQAIEIARKHIMKALPFIEKAPIIIKEMHY